MGTCTISAFMFGLWTLPSRVSTFKYTAIGFGIGLVASYGYWRYSMNKYYDTLNTHFKRIIKEKYLQNKYAEKYTEK